MMKRNAALYISFLLLLSSPLSAQLLVSGLACENQVNPIGIGERTPRFSWQITSSARNTVQDSYELSVSQGQKKVWASGRVKSDQSVHIAYNGAALLSGESYSWKVRVWDNHGRRSEWSSPATFRVGVLSPDGWKAKWIEAGFAEDSVNRPAQYFRKEFNTSKKISTAIIYITAHGMYEALLNGHRVGDQYLSPGWTSYNKRLQYQVYDVTSQLQQGVNAIGVIVGNGWYRGYLAWENNRNSYGKTSGLLCQIEITYADGTRYTVATDESWKCSTGAIIYDEIYHGETIDARLEKKGWSLPNYSETGWSPVKTASYGYDNLVATLNEPVRKHEVFDPVRILTTPKGEKVIDFGQNLVGWVTVTAAGKPGDRISIQHAEVLDKNGNFYIDNLRAAKATAQYLLSGKGTEQFEPHFTFFGFRYIRVNDYPGEIKPENFRAVALYSDMKQTGSFSTSDSLINQLQHNIQWGQRGNFLDVPTDCPQRDERLGWTGDAQVFSSTAAFNFGVNAFFAKWLKDVAADQQSNGSVPFVIPNVLGANSGGATGWADVCTIIPWNLYRIYGDRKVLDDQYNSMKAWVGYMERRSVNDLWNTGFHFGDWLFYRPFDDNDGRSAVTDKYLIAQCFFAHSTQLIINTARVLNNPDDEQRYTRLLAKLKAAFVREYCTPSGRLVSGTQTAYVLALQFDMLPDSLRIQAAARLVDNIRDYGMHLTTGFLGTPYLCDVLTRFGYADIAYALLMQRTYPSWLYPVTKGATTIWERWNGIRTDGTFEPASMNSFNHYAYGAIGDWMYRNVAGLAMDENVPAYKSIVIKPRIGGGLTGATASYLSVYGKISSSWKKATAGLVLDVEIPANTTAVIYIPASSPDAIREGGRLISLVTDLQMEGNEEGFVKVKAGSGSYHFETTTAN